MRSACALPKPELQLGSPFQSASSASSPVFLCWPTRRMARVVRTVEVPERRREAIQTPGAPAWRRRQAAGGMPYSRRKARLKAVSVW